MIFFKCKHPARWLGVERHETKEPIDRDFERVDYHLTCRRCGEEVEISYAKIIGGVDKFIANAVERKS